MTELKITGGATFKQLGQLSGKTELYRVNDGVNAAEALQYADDLFSSIERALYDAFMNDPLKGDPAVLAHHAMKSARAVLHSVIGTLEDIQEQAINESASH